MKKLTKLNLTPTQKEKKSIRGKALDSARRREGNLKSNR